MGIKHFAIAKNHPYSSRHRFRFLYNYIRINLLVRVYKDPIEFRWINKSKFYVSKGESGVIGNVYCRLYEYHEMSFLLRTLRAGDQFIDVGANSGIYTILATAVCGSNALSFEPNIRSLQRLTANLELNKCLNLAKVFPYALLDQNGYFPMTVNADTGNSIDIQKQQVDTEMVEVRTLDEFAIFGNPLFLKIDVEGLELPVLKGAYKTLINNETIALIVETNSLSKEYGNTFNDLDSYLRDTGFKRFVFNGLTNSLFEAGQESPISLNSIYLKNPEKIYARLEEN